MMREPSDGAHGFGICVKGGKEAGNELSTALVLLEVKSSTENKLTLLKFPVLATKFTYLFDIITAASGAVYISTWWKLILLFVL